MDEAAPRIAAAGAKKMTGQGYTFRLFPMSQAAGHPARSGGQRLRWRRQRLGFCSSPAPG